MEDFGLLLNSDDNSDAAPVYEPDPMASPGNDTSPVPQSDPWNFDPFEVFGKVIDVVNQGVGAYTTILNTRDQASLKRQQQQANIDLARQQIDSRRIVDTARINAETAVAQRQFAAMPGLTTLFGGPTAPSGSDYLMLVLTAIGVYFAYRALGHQA